MRKRLIAHQILLTATLFLVSACGDGGSPNSDSTQSDGGSLKSESSQDVVSEPKTTVQTNIVFENITIDLESDPWNWPMDTNSWPARDYHPIHIFGENYQGKVESTLTFDMLKIGQSVISPVDGVVIDNRPQPEDCDTELYIMDSKSQQIFSIDHITSTLKRDDQVKVGQIIATVPAWQCKEDFGRYELMLVKEENGKMQAYCPLDFINPTSKPDILLSISKVITEWNNVASTDRSKYTSEQMSGNLCLTPTAPA